MSRPDLSQHFKPAEPWHHDVEKYEIELVSCDGVEGRYSIRSLPNGMSLSLETAHKQVSVIFQVVYDQNAKRTLLDCQCNTPHHRLDARDSKWRGLTKYVGPIVHFVTQQTWCLRSRITNVVE